MLRPEPIELENDYVALRPLSPVHAEAFYDIGQDAEIWRYLPVAPLRSPDDAEAWIAAMLARARSDGDVSFSAFDQISGCLAGTSSYLDVRVPHGGLEIGFTWYGTAFQRTHVNTATKLLLLQHAFETLGAHRVQLQTDARNVRSRAAIARLGATEEGLLRKHKVYPDGYVRDSVMFSVIADEWPQIKSALQHRLAKSPAA